jgi:hypothetical protein
VVAAPQGQLPVDSFKLAVLALLRTCGVEIPVLKQ